MNQFDSESKESSSKETPLVELPTNQTLTNTDTDTIDSKNVSIPANNHTLSLEIKRKKLLDNYQAQFKRWDAEKESYK